MVYLIISDGITRNDRLWMNRNTIRLGRGTWLANGKGSFTLSSQPSA
mgnify:CR=1 FL=1